MATFDQLPADQRAIIELVLKRGRSYSQLSDLLGMPETRVRELAREALVVLAPVTADRVDPEWRNQVADYALGQQAGAEVTATQGHLRRSETARAWLGSLLDSLEQLYDKDNLPELPEGDGSERPRGRERRPREERSRTGERAARGGHAAAATATADAAKDEDADEEESEPEKAPVDPRTRRQERRLIFGGVVLVVLLAVLVMMLTGVFGGDDDDGGGGGGGTNTNAADTTQGQTGQNGDTQIIGELALKPTDPDAAEDTVGIAQIATDGTKAQVGIRAKLPAVKSNQAYEVWLYNKKGDAVSLGAARTDAEGNFEGAAPLPEGYDKYKFIDISVEPVNKDAEHSGDSVLRGALADLVTPEQQQQQGQGGQQTTPSP